MRRRVTVVAGLGGLTLLLLWSVGPFGAAPAPAPSERVVTRYVSPPPAEGTDRARRRVQLGTDDPSPIAEPDPPPPLTLGPPGEHRGACHLALELDGVAAELRYRIDGPEGPVDAQTVAYARGPVLYLLFPTPDGEGTLHVPGHEAVRLSWRRVGARAIACAPDPIPLEPTDVWLTGHVRNAAALPPGTVWVAGCGQSAHLVDADGGFAFPLTPGTTCTVNAHRRAGQLRIWGDPVTLVAPEDHDVEVELWVPEWAPAGMGVTIEAVDDGIRILHPLPGSPAAQAGLRSGDLVLDVDGQSTEGMTLQEFVEWGVGPEGTEVNLRVRGEEGERTVTLTRRLLD